MSIPLKFFAERINRITPSPTLAIASKARELKELGKDIITLGAGEPDFDTPANIKISAIKAINEKKTKYTAVDGIPSLKEAICNKFRSENNLDYLPTEITVGSGAKQVIFNALLATLNKQDEVIIPAPYWVSYPDMVSIAEGKPVIVKTSEQNNFKITPEELERSITQKTKWLILNSPNNPTGACYTYDELRALAEVLLKYPHVFIMSDDIYEHIIFDNLKFYTIGQVEPTLKDRLLSVNGVSKAYAMTGWRIGYAAGPRMLISAIGVIQSQSTSNPCSISQYAALEALTGPKDFLKESVEIFQNRRNIAYEMLSSTPGIHCNKPDGSFYIFPSCEKIIGKRTAKGHIISNCTDFAEYLLDEALVAVVSGTAFGMPHFFRISYATSETLLRTACERIKKACADLI